ncbi:hypothetical protein AA313_de0206193 [Arthrobotrys entomopaga]|nr:hypothetical protein AA313_de0206193 [Arthrobotrys entomopaga]
MTLPTASVFPQDTCDCGTPISAPEEPDVFEVVSMHDWVDRFSVIPIAETLKKWERNRTPLSIPRTRSNKIISQLVINSTYYSWEHAIYTKVIISMLETFDSHAVKMLRRKKIKGDFYGDGISREETEGYGFTRGRQVDETDAVELLEVVLRIVVVQ